MKILIIEDDINLAKVLAYDLNSSNYEVKILNDGNNLEEELVVNYDLILLDWMLPGVEGIDLIKVIKKHSKAIIIMLTAKSEEANIVAAFNAGIDDYVTKPFLPLAFIARINAHLKFDDKKDFLIFNQLKIDLKNYEVFKNDDLVKLSKTEFKLLVFLVENKDKVLMREQIQLNVWGYENDAETRVVDVHISKLRDKVLESTEIKTVHGVGYRLISTLKSKV